MRTPFATFPYEPTFEEIAAKWPLGGGATDADTVLEQLIQFMWRGDFEERNRPTLFLAGPPDGCDMDAAGVVTRRRPERIGGAPYVLVAPTWSGPGGARNVAQDGRGLPFRKWAALCGGEWIDSDDPLLSDPALQEEIVRHDCPDDPEDFEAEFVAGRVCYLHTRADVLSLVKACGFRIEGMTDDPDAMFMIFASLPLRGYVTDRGDFSTTPRRLRIRLGELAEWFDTSGLDWPRPAWLPPPLWIPDPTFVDPADPQPDFRDRKANTITEIVGYLDSQHRKAFLADAIDAIRAGRLAVMMRAVGTGRRRGMLIPMAGQAVRIETDSLTPAERAKYITERLLVTREALKAWYRPRGQAPTLDEIWPAPDAPKETAPEVAPAAAPDAVPEEAPPAPPAPQEEPAPAPTLAPPFAPAAGEVPAAEKAAPAPPSKRGRPRNRGGFDHIDGALIRKSIKGRRRGVWTSANMAAKDLVADFVATKKKWAGNSPEAMTERLRKKIGAAWAAEGL